MRKYFLNKRGTNNKLWGPLLPWVQDWHAWGVAGSGHPSFFFIGVVDRLPLWEHLGVLREKLLKGMFTHTHTVYMPGCAEWRWRWCDRITPGSLIMSSPRLLPSSYLQSHSACITERLLTGLTPRLPQHTPPSQPVPKQVANTPPTPDNFTFLIPLFLGKHFSALSRDEEIKQSSFFFFF